MNKYWNKKLLALILSASLMAGTGVSAFAADQDAEAGTAEGAVYETEQMTENASDQENISDADAASEEGTVVEETVTDAEESPAPEAITEIEEAAEPETVITEVANEGESGEGGESSGSETDPTPEPEPEPEIKDIAGASVAVSPASFVYDGKAKTPAVTVTYSGTTLQAGKDYNAAFTNNVNVGTATVTISGIGNYKGSVSNTFTITAASIAGAGITGVASKVKFVFDGVKPVPTVTLGGVTLKAGTDYQVSYANNTKCGTATLTVSGIGNYNGQVSKNFTIVKTSLKSTKINKIKAQVYTGKKLKPNPVITLNGVRLKKGRDYTLKYKNNKKHGKATVIIKGKGNFKGTVKKTFKIKKATIANAKITGLKNKTYTGSKITQKLKVKIGKKKLKEGRDYKISYKSNVSVGKATVTIKGIKEFKGSRKLTFKIKKRSIKKAKVSGLTEQGYTGKAVKPDLKIVVAGRTLKEGTDYTLTFANNVNIGTATVTIKARGNYKGSLTGTFPIVRQTLDKAKVTVSDCTYNGYDQMPVVTVKLKDKTLKAGTDYKVRYSNNVNVGTAQVTVTGMGIYAGSKNARFKILPPATSLTSVANQESNILVKWNRPGNGFHYQVQWATDNAFKSVVSEIETPDQAEYTIRGRQLSNTFVRIRTVYRANNSVYYSGWTVWR